MGIAKTKTNVLERCYGYFLGGGTGFFVVESCCSSVICGLPADASNCGFGMAVDRGATRGFTIDGLVAAVVSDVLGVVATPGGFGAVATVGLTAFVADGLGAVN